MIYTYAGVEERVALGRISRDEADVMHGFARALRRDSGADLSTLTHDDMRALGQAERVERSTT